MNHHQAFSEFPKHVTAALQIAHDGMLANIRVIERYEDAESLFVYQSFGGRSHEERCYMDDGNTPTPGMRYACVWFHGLKFEESSLLPRYGAFYNGSHTYCVVHQAEVTVRTFDLSIRRTACEIQVGLWSGRKPERIHLNMNTADIRLRPYQMADLIERIEEIRARIALENRLTELMK